MSGIVAAHGRFDPRLGHRMLALLAHRGPDGEGSREVGGSWLGHRRLAIVDLEREAAPLMRIRRHGCTTVPRSTRAP
jgi:asparagine synthase (glutamine-hydrolysing)